MSKSQVSMDTKNYKVTTAVGSPGQGGENDCSHQSGPSLRSQANVELLTLRWQNGLFLNLG